jgi:hypothetical protein
LQDRDATQIGQAQIENDDVVTLLRGGRESLFAGAGIRHPISIRFERDAQ